MIVFHSRVWRRVLPVMLLMLLLAGGGRRAAAQEAGNRVLQQVGVAFAEGDARVLLGTAADRLEIGIFGANTLFSRAQALYVMQEFFREHPPERFAFQEYMKTNGSWFAAGTYWHQPGERLQIYVRLRERGQHWELREIRIEPHSR